MERCRRINTSRPALKAFRLMLVTALLMLAGFQSASADTSQSNPLTAKQLLDHIDQLWRGNTSHTLMQMQVKTRRYQRTMEMEAWSMGDEHSLVVIQQPVKDKGIATLKVEENIWNYLPKINRVTKVPASMMSGSWMGSHFTNDDLVKESQFAEDYNSEITFNGTRDASALYEITAIPKPDAAVVWGKVVIEIDQQTLAPIRSLYFDEQQSLIRSMLFEQLQQIGRYQVPMVMRLIPEDKPGESTVITYKSIEFDLPLNARFFSLQNLKRGR